MSLPSDQPNDKPKICPTCGTKKQSVKIKAGKWVGLATLVTIVTQILCSFDIQIVP